MVKKETVNIQLLCDAVCPVCGKTYFIPSVKDWAWKAPINNVHNKRVCTYTCMRKAQAIHDSKRKRKHVNKVSRYYD